MSSMYQTVNQAVGAVMLGLGLSPDKRILVRMHMIDFLYQYRQDTDAVLKELVVYPIPQSLTIPFPRDYMGWSKVGWVVDGQVKLVAENKNIAANLIYNQKGVFTGFPTAIYKDPAGNPVPATTYGIPYNNVWGNRGGSGTVSGAMIPELNGFFKEDTENRVFRLSTVNKFPTFYLVYASDCFDPTDEYCIHPAALLAAKQWARWKYLKDAYNTSAFKVADEAKQYDIEETKMIRRLKNMSAMDYLTTYDKVFGYND
jgi:hypothetical protein